MNFTFYPYTNLQIKQRHNSKMLYGTYIEIRRRYNLQFRYKMLWQRHKDGYQLLTKHNLITNKREYLGRKDKDTQKISSGFITSKKEIKVQLKHIKVQLARNQKLNKLEGIARTPKELVTLFRKINELGLDKKLIVIGTNSLYAYEARAGIFIEEEHLATRDIDILNRKDKKVSFLANELMTSKSALALLQSVDKSFYQNGKVPYRFINKEGVWVELITTMKRGNPSKKPSTFFTDIIALDMKGMQWLENARLFKETIIAEDGSTAQLSTVQPLEYAIDKNWLGQQEERDFQKHTRDVEQSKLVTKIIIDYMLDIDIEEEVKNLKHFNREVVEDYIKNIYIKMR